MGIGDLASVKRQTATSLGLNYPMVGLWFMQAQPPLPLRVLDDLVEHGAEWGAEGTPP
jgi:hypothetical protein